MENILSNGTNAIIPSTNIVSSTPCAKPVSPRQFCANTSDYVSDKSISYENDENYDEEKCIENTPLKTSTIRSSSSDLHKNACFSSKTPSQIRKIAEYAHQLPPAPKSSSKKKFQHVVSPISVYINQAKIPLFKTVNSIKDNDILISSNKGPVNEIESPENLMSLAEPTLPHVKCTAASKKRIIDNREMVVPGGKEIKKLIGSSALVIRHNGRVKSDESVLSVFELNESISELSELSGDESILIVNDARTSQK